MLTIQQKVQCVLWYYKLKSPTAVQRKFRNEFGQDPPHTNSIKKWFKNLCYTHSINNLFINVCPTRSFAIQNTAGLHKIFKPSLNAVSVRRVLSKLISE